MSLLNEIDLFCPECNGTIQKQVCQTCKKTHQMIDGVPSFLSNEDETSDMFKRYFDNYATIAHDDMERDIMPVAYKNAQANKLLQYCKEKVHGTVLDVGCAKGDFLKRVPHNKKIGVDISIEYLKLIRQSGIEGIFANAENLPFINAFDLVVAMDILEHVFHPGKVLEGIHRAMKSDGITVIRVPYKEDLNKYTAEAGCKYEFVHLRSFDKDVLMTYIRNAGFRVRKIHFDGFSITRLTRNHPRLIKRQSTKIIDMIFEHFAKLRLSFAQRDAFIHKLPNCIGNRFLKPYEMTAVLQKQS